MRTHRKPGVDRPLRVISGLIMGLLPFVLAAWLPSPAVRAQSAKPPAGPSPRPGAAPVITSLANAASNLAAGLPGAGIARGSLFVIKGSGLGPATFAIATAFPLTTSLAGTSVRVTMAGRNFDAIIYYTGAEQVAAILPSAVPAGDGVVTVTYNGQAAAAPAPITVVESALGIYTATSTGAADAIATNGAELVTPGNAAHPGDIVVFWGTGLGPVTFDETNAAQQADMTHVPLEAFVAGRPAEILFRGRAACCTSVDIVYVRVPPGVAGCSTPVVFKIGETYSNTTTIAVSESGRTCTPVLNGLNTSLLTRFFSRSGGTASAGYVVLFRSLNSNSRFDGGTASFQRFTLANSGFGFSSWDLPPLGSCTVSALPQGAMPQWQGDYQQLDAGAALIVSAGGSSRPLLKITESGPFNYNALFDAAGAFLNAEVTVTGTGGATVGPFVARMNLPGPPLAWTNQTSIETVDVDEGVTVTWSGGNPNGQVEIKGNSAAPGIPWTYFRCAAATSAGSFTVPPLVLRSLPSNASGAPGELNVGQFSPAFPFEAQGLNLAYLIYGEGNSRPVTYRKRSGGTPKQK